jgi:flagellar protein FliS
MNMARSLARMREESLATATPERMVVLLYDRLVVDIERAQAALEREAREEAGEALTHAQRIVDELRFSLDASAWDGAAGLASLYDYLAVTLVRANVSGNPDLVRACREVAAPLRDTWHEAALEAAAPPPGGEQPPSAARAGDLGVA